MYIYKKAVGSKDTLYTNRDLEGVLPGPLRYATNVSVRCRAVL